MNPSSVVEQAVSDHRDAHVPGCLGPVIRYLQRTTDPVLMTSRLFGIVSDERKSESLALTTNKVPVRLEPIWLDCTSDASRPRTCDNQPASSSTTRRSLHPALVVSKSSHTGVVYPEQHSPSTIVSSSDLDAEEFATLQRLDHRHPSVQLMSALHTGEMTMESAHVDSVVRRYDYLPAPPARQCTTAGPLLAHVKSLVCDQLSPRIAHFVRPPYLDFQYTSKGPKGAGSIAARPLSFDNTRRQPYGYIIPWASSVVHPGRIQEWQ